MLSSAPLIRGNVQGRDYSLVIFLLYCESLSGLGENHTVSGQLPPGLAVISDGIMLRRPPLLLSLNHSGIIQHSLIVQSVHGGIRDGPGLHTCRSFEESPKMQSKSYW
jgi:hypothetical protein